MRPLWHETFFDLADVWAKRATCPRLKAGAVIVNPIARTVITAGYTGAPYGLEHCTKVGCQIVDGHCRRALHAELNALLQAAREGRSVHGMVLYTQCRPCVACLKALYQAGIDTVYYRQVKENDAYAWEVYTQLGARGFRLMYVPPRKSEGGE
jgi:dCMP deaminase